MVQDSLQIQSNPDSANPKPWYEFDVDSGNGRMTITKDADGGSDVDLTGASLDLQDINPDEPFRVVVTKGGELTTYQFGEDAPPLRAHLSPPTTVQDLELYEFVE